MRSKCTQLRKDAKKDTAAKTAHKYMLGENGIEIESAKCRKWVSRENGFLFPEYRFSAVDALFYCWEMRREAILFSRVSMSRFTEVADWQKGLHCSPIESLLSAYNL